MPAKVYLAKDERYVNQKILDSANGKHCTVNGPTCIGGTETTVWCHSPFAQHGKAGSRKSHDCFGCYGCRACHDWLDARDNSRAAGRVRYWRFVDAQAKSLLILLREGVLT